MMTDYTIHDAAGKILSIVGCSASEITKAVADAGGAGYIAGSHSWDTHRVSGGAAVPFPQRPSTNHHWNWQSHTWADPRDLEAHRAAKWEEIKAAREAALYAPLATPHGTFDADVRGQTSISNTVLLSQFIPGFTTEFTLADNTSVTLTAAQMAAVGIALGARTMAAHEASRNLRALIWATPQSGLAAITWAM